MSIYDFNVKDTDGSCVSLADYEGKVLLIVNSATKCGFTPQYNELTEIYNEFKDDGFIILDFPCNQFMEQAKGNDEEISSFCTLKYDTTFPRFKKIDVNGENESPLYTFLKNAIAERDNKGFSVKNVLLSLTSKINGKSGKKSDIKWNFEKFLVDKNGNVVKRFAPTVTPEQIESELEKLLSA